MGGVPGTEGDSAARTQLGPEASTTGAGSAEASESEAFALPSRLEGVNRSTLAGAVLVLGGGVLYATGETAYASLAGATDPLSFGWVFDLQGLAFVLLGLGLALAFVGLGRGSIRLGGIVAFVGGILVGAGYFAYASLLGQTSFPNTLWTNQLEAVGFFVLSLGLMLGLAGLAILGTGTASRVRRRSWLR